MGWEILLTVDINKLSMPVSCSGRQWSQAVSLAFEFMPRDVLKHLFQRADGRTALERAQCLLELHYFGFDDQLGALCFTFAFANV